jgi:ATP synthase protein I
MSPDNTSHQNESQGDRQNSRRIEFRRRIRRKLTRHQKAQQDKNELFFGLGVFGVVGWSVAIPTLIGIALGVWIDKTWPSPYSWTLMLLFLGVILGCLNAWFWIEAVHRGD